MPEPESPLKAVVHSSIPRHFNNPVALAVRILASGNDEALCALVSAGMQGAFTPFDIALSIRERRIYERAEPPQAQQQQKDLINRFLAA